jgi:hypothetical protein
MTCKRVGGLVFWRIGKLGGSFYWAAPKSPARRHDEMLARALRHNRKQTLRWQAWLWRHVGTPPSAWPV